MLLDFSGHKEKALKDRLTICVYQTLTFCHIMLYVVESAGVNTVNLFVHNQTVCMCT